MVPLVTCRVDALFVSRDIPMGERLRSNQIREALKLGWRYVRRGSSGYWLKNGVRFLHMHNYILEVFNRGQYKDLDVEGKVVVDVGAGFGGEGAADVVRLRSEVVAEGRRSEG